MSTNISPVMTLEALRSVPLSCAASARRLQCWLQLRTRGLECRRQTKCDAGQYGSRKAEKQNTNVNMDSVHARQCLRQQPQCGTCSPCRQEHSDAAVPLYSVIGGKLTTCRSLAEQAAQTLLPRLGMERKNDSRERPIPGKRDREASGEPTVDAHVLLPVRNGCSRSWRRPRLCIRGPAAAEPTLAAPRKQEE